MKAHATFRRLCLVLALSGAAAGCETFDKLNPFAEKEKILPGQRTAVFPEGVPGVDYSAPPPQPSGPGGSLPPAPAEAAKPAGQ
ncbi:MAG TPA: hypothetical protein VLA00_16760 [Xanthobacteraceae bacterium]|nr:hypothetical protein [Xanthobacteraceae bacterium]